MNIHCAICNEPWDDYGLSHGDVAAWEADMIRKGYGCPCCIQNGFNPTEEYVEPKQLVVFRCDSCESDITIDQSEIQYDGTELVCYKPEHVYCDDGIICIKCYERDYSYCENCSKTIATDVSVYLQNLEVNLCEDCCEKYYSSCYECGEMFHNSDLEDRYCDSCKPKEEDDSAEEV